MIDETTRRIFPFDPVLTTLPAAPAPGRTKMLTLSGERKAEHEHKREGYYRLERSFGSFQRSLTLPEGVNADQVAANFEKGVLEIRIPKPEQRKPRRVQIGVSGQQPETIEGKTS